MADNSPTASIASNDEATTTTTEDGTTSSGRAKWDSDLFCLDLEERLGMDMVYEFPFANYDTEEIIMELLLRKEQSTVPWRSMPSIRSDGIKLKDSEFSLLRLPPEIWMLVFNFLPGYDAICLALSCRTMYNVGRKRLENMVCARHLGRWAGKQIVWLYPSASFEVISRMPELYKVFKKLRQRELADTPQPTLAKLSIQNEPKEIRPIDLAMKFTRQFPILYPREDDFPPFEPEADMQPREERKLPRLKVLAPEIRRMQAIWNDFHAGRQFVPEPLRRFVEGNFDHELHLSIYQDEVYVLRNLDKKVYIEMSDMKTEEFLLSVGYSNGISSMINDDFEYGRWVGCRFDIVKKEMIENDDEWEWAGAARRRRYLEMLAQVGIQQQGANLGG
ncbi:hypothetical protein ABW19_dt0204486 [Dactylella cylindrospora]|nr:hypothetical protein ABW19_dt0204486 [Dactylella cylindrospora]